MTNITETIEIPITAKLRMKQRKKKPQDIGEADAGKLIVTVSTKVSKFQKLRMIFALVKIIARVAMSSLKK